MENKTTPTEPQKKKDILADLLAGKISFYDETPRSKRKKILAEGLSKSGKTRFGSTIESDPSHLFIIDTDGSLDGLPLNYRHVPHISIPRADVLKRIMPVYATVDAILMGIRDRRPPFENISTLMFDGLTTLSDLLIIEAMLDSAIGKGAKDPLKQKAEYDHFSVIQDELLTIFTKVDDLDVNIYATAGLKLDSEESSGVTVIMPDILGGFRGKAENRFDAVLNFVEEGGKYYAYTRTHGRFRAGVRNYTGPDKIENPDFSKIFDPKNFSH